MAGKAASSSRKDDEEAVQTARLAKGIEYFGSKARQLLDMEPVIDRKALDDDVEYVIGYLGWNYTYYELEKSMSGYTLNDALLALSILESAIEAVRQELLSSEQPTKEGVVEETFIKLR